MYNNFSEGKESEHIWFSVYSAVGNTRLKDLSEKTSDSCSPDKIKFECRD